MRGWTGGQYSLWRIAFAVHLASHELILALIAIPIALGWYARVFWGVLAVYWIVGWFWVLPGGLMMFGIIVAQLFVRGDPYLSWARRNAADPGTDWRMSRLAPLIVLLSPALELLRPRYVPGPEMWPSAIIFAVLFCIPPLWIVRPRRASARDTIFYDGHCAVCHGTVRFLMAEDADGSQFHFAPLQSEAFIRQVSEEVRRTLPDSVVVQSAAGEILTKYAGVRYALERLGGYWRVAGIVMRALPVRYGDHVYDFIARRRYRMFGRKTDVCPLMPPQLRDRFEV